MYSKRSLTAELALHIKWQSPLDVSLCNKRFVVECTGGSVKKWDVTLLKRKLLAIGQRISIFPAQNFTKIATSTFGVP